MMTMKAIKAMFAPGQVWIGMRTPGFNGQAATVTRRTIFKVRSADYVCDNGDGKGRFYGTFPARARDVIEARDGYLKFKMDEKVSIELVRETPPTASEISREKP